MTGLDLGEALVSVSEGLDRDFARDLLVIAETAFLAALAKRQAEDAEQDDKDEDDD